MTNDTMTERIIGSSLTPDIGSISWSKNCVVIELKSVEKLLPLHLAQVMTYLKLSGNPVGLLINFNVPHLRQGTRSVVNNYEEKT